jgi:uncharacterized protein (TIGR02722 family)
MQDAPDGPTRAAKVWSGTRAGAIVPAGANTCRREETSVMRTVLCIGLTALACLSCVGCRNPQVDRLRVDEVKDLSGRWNDTDSRLVSEQMIGAVLDAAWLGDFQTQKKRKPVVIVGTIRNLSSEHIETDTFVKDIERELVRSGKVRFVASRRERDEVREERRDMLSHATEESAARLAAETGADFMLKGGVRTQNDIVEGKQVRYYQVDLELVQIESNEKVWLDTKKIRKFVRQSSLKF